MKRDNFDLEWQLPLFESGMQNYLNMRRAFERAGDDPEKLRAVALEMLEVIRTSGVIAAFGGDEAAHRMATRKSSSATAVAARQAKAAARHDAIRGALAETDGKVDAAVLDSELNATPAKPPLARATVYRAKGKKPPARG